MTDPTHKEDSQIDKALGEDWPGKTRDDFGGKIFRSSQEADAYAARTAATPDELAFIRELQHFYCDHIVDGVPTGDWHINHTPEQAARLLRVHVACAIREQQENHALQLGDLYRENSGLRKAAERLRWLHTGGGSGARKEWGVAEIEFDANGKVIGALWGFSDSRDVDAAMAAEFADEDPRLAMNRPETYGLPESH